MTTYYSDADIEISDEHIKLGSNTFQTRDVESFEARTMWLHFWLQWKFLPLPVALFLFAINLVVAAVRLADVFSGRGGRTDSIYAQDWTDFLLPLALVTASFGFIVFSEPKLLLGIILKGRTGKLGSYTTSDARLLGEITAALGSALRGAKLAQHSNSSKEGAISDKEIALYSSAGAEVTDDLVVLMGKEYRVSDIQEVRIRTEGGRSTLNLITSLVIPLLIILLWVPQMLPLFSTQPVLGPDGIQFPIAWLTAVGYLAFAVTWIGTMIRLAIRKFLQPERVTPTYLIHIITLWGRLGIHDRNVILSTEAYRSLDRIETKKIAEAIELAITRNRLKADTPEHLGNNDRPHFHVRRVTMTGLGGS